MQIDKTADIPTIVAEEIRLAQLADIPATDQPGYVADRIRSRIAGCREYTRKRQMPPAVRAAEIRRRFDGTNIAALSVEFDLSQRRIGQIVNSK